jgi:hypothetical protein
LAERRIETGQPLEMAAEKSGAISPCIPSIGFADAQDKNQEAIAAVLSGNGCTRR